MNDALGALKRRADRWLGEGTYRHVFLAMWAHSLLTVSLVATGAYLLVWHVVRTNFARQSETIATFVADRVAAEIEDYQRDVRALSSNSLFVNAIVDTSAGRRYLAPFLGSLRTEGTEDARLTLCNYLGAPLCSNGGPGERYAAAEILAAAEGRGRDVGLVLEDGGLAPRLLLACPVRWQATGTAEGIFVAELEAQRLLARALRGVPLAESSGVRLTVDGRPLALYGSGRKLGRDLIRRNLMLGEPTAGLRLGVDYLDARETPWSLLVATYGGLLVALGALTGVVARGISSALTARLRAEQEERGRLEGRMREAQRLESLGILAGGVAHDFNNMLQGILGNLELSMRKVGPDAPVRRFLEAAEKTSLRAAELTTQMLAYSGKGRLVVEPISMTELLGDMVQLLRSVVPRHVEIRCEFADESTVVVGDATQLRQVVMNMITNASDAIGAAAGTVTVKSGALWADRALLGALFLGDGLAEGRYAYLEVADNGVGMDAATVERMFDPFFTTKQTGRGIGLSAVQGIVRGHRGALSVESKPGEGTRFRVLLPSPDGARAA